MKIIALLFLLTGVQSLPQSQSRPPRPCPTTHLDINTATKDQLVALEGITPEIADLLIKRRPHKSISTVQDRFPQDVWEKVMVKLCFNGAILTSPPKRQIQVIPGNKFDTIRFEPKPEQETDPNKPPSPSVVPPR